MATVITGSGSGGGGLPINNIGDVPAIPKTLAVDATYTLPISGEQGQCWIRYGTDTSVSFDFATDGTVNILVNKGFGTAVDTASKVNIYKSGTDIIVQNKTIASVDLAIAYTGV